MRRQRSWSLLPTTRNDGRPHAGNDVENLTTAIAAGGDIPALTAALADRDKRLKALDATLAKPAVIPDRDGCALRCASVGPSGETCCVASTSRRRASRCST
jgi:hypothetical protein